MDYQIQAGQTSRRIAVFIADASAGDGSGLTGLVYNTSGLTCYYWREDQGDAAATSVTLATATRGTFTSGGFKEKDSTNQPGMYEFGIPDAALASGASWVVFLFKGASGMVTTLVTVRLTGYNPEKAFPLTKGTALSAFTFPMVDSSGIGVTGLTITATRSIDGAAFASCTNSASEISGGWYKINLSSTDLNGSVIALKFTATGAVMQTYTFVMQQT
jgi:hypothetical protein